MRVCRAKWMLRQLFHCFFLSILAILVIGAALAYLYNSTFLNSSSSSSNPSKSSNPLQKSGNSALSSISSYDPPSFQLIPLSSAPIRYVTSSPSPNITSTSTSTSSSSCTMFSCFSIHRCGGSGGASATLSIYIYPIHRWFIDGIPLQSTLSSEFLTYLQTLRNSPYYTPDPGRACLFIPSIDLLNLNRLQITQHQLLCLLSAHPYWTTSGAPGQNHLLLSLFPGNSPLLQLPTSAIIATSGLPTPHYRPGFHIPLITPGVPSPSPKISSPPHFITALLPTASPEAQLLSSIPNLLPLTPCPPSSSPSPLSFLCSLDHPPRLFPYPSILRTSTFCLLLHDLASPLLWTILESGCVPVLVTDNLRLPFDEVIDWRQISVQLYQSQLPDLKTVLGSISQNRIKRLRLEGAQVWRRWMGNMTKITEAVVRVVKHRVFGWGGGINHWMGEGEGVTSNPLFNTGRGGAGAKEEGFTALILAYDRVESLFEVVRRVGEVKSLRKVLVVWNNQKKEPPDPLGGWPRVGVPVQIVRMGENKMSNRFRPFEEIETEAVFSLDDDIVMLTRDEMQFAFDTWREFPDRLVGFPSRSHVWDNGTARWKYESEWTSEISMVLTGAAFYHKYWHHAYTSELSPDIRDWVDAKMNCEDIAMNFLVAARTGKGPIKVTPRKKFKCPTCSQNEMLSTDSGHMVERTECINRFSQLMGGNPLVPTEFRADPVLYKVEGVPARLKWYPDMGTM